MESVYRYMCVHIPLCNRYSLNLELEFLDFRLLLSFNVILVFFKYKINLVNLLHPSLQGWNEKTHVKAL